MIDTLPNFPPGKAALFKGAGLPFEFITSHVPFIKPEEILVKVLYTTICGSDIHTYCGRRFEPANVVLGHEIVGEILWIDQVHSGKDYRGNPIELGDRITWSIFSVPEGISPPRPDMPQKSEHIYKYGHTSAEKDTVFNGGLAEYCIIRSNTTFIKISVKIPLKIAATISCAHSTVMGALRTAGDVKQKNIIIFGAGLLGLSCIAMCREAGASVITVVDVDAHRLQLADKFGADHIYPFPSEAGAVLPWPEVDLVFDMTGNPQAMKMGIDSLLVGGYAVWIGAVFNENPVQIDAQKIVRNLLQIRGLYNYNYEDFLNATLFIETNYQKYPFEDLIEKEFFLEDIEEAFAFATNNKPVRVGIKTK